MAQQLKLFLVIQNSYLKDDDFQDPIKKYLKPYFLTSASNHSIFYYMMVSKNDVELYDSKLLGSPVQMEYIETRVDYSVTQQMVDELGDPNSYIGVYIQMDDGLKNTSRKVATF